MDKQIYQTILPPSAVIRTTYTHDAMVVVSIAIMTVALRSQLGSYFEKKVPDWLKLRPGSRSRVCVEAAVIPSRILLAYFSFPIILHGFSPIQSWLPQDTIQCLLICSILTGAYIIDLTVSRPDQSATLHHIMGPTLLLWIRISYSTFTPYDALLCRLLMSFVFFGAVFSGSATSALLFIVFFRKIWFKPEQRTNVNKTYIYFTLLLLVLALSTVTGNFYVAIYLHTWFDEVFAHFGHWGYLPLAWVLLECSMQWRWLFWFFKREVKYRQEFAEGMAGGKTDRSSLPEANVWWLPSWRFVVLKVLTVIWYTSVLGLIWRSGDVHYLWQSLGEFVGKFAGLARQVISGYHLVNINM